MDLSAVEPELMEEIKGAFSPEQIAKIEACESLDEVFALIESEGIELPDELLEPVAGGKYQSLSNLLLKCGYHPDVNSGGFTLC